MLQPIALGRNSTTDAVLYPKLANRHGCITGATGTGKTVTLQLMAEAFSRIGTPVFLADVKGDLSGITQAASMSEGLQKRLDKLGLPAPQFGACPTVFWDVFGEKGHPVRATISDMGPLLLARVMNLNDTQTGILNICFKLADDEGLLLLDLKDLRSMLQFVSDNARSLRPTYGNISPASVGAIQRALLELEVQGADQFFGEPMLDIFDLMRCDAQGQGVVNILAAEKLMQSPRLYGVFLLWLLAELFDNLPEVGDLEQPKLVFFFDEAHLLFDNAPKALLERIELVVRLIRSKGVGVFFVTQNPLDIPEAVLGQLGNRVQHALRAYTPRDQRAVKTAADTMRPNPPLNIQQSISELGVGEALVSFLDPKGIPSPTERVWMFAPGSRIGLATEDKIARVRATSPFGNKYDQSFDRESAYEVLTRRAEEESQAAALAAQKAQAGGGVGGLIKDVLLGSSGPRGGRREGLVEQVAKTEARRITRNLIRGVLGSLLGGAKRR
ncbi:helicase HerA-like domain-containing protein [Oligella urethralis]|uniref:helicase HerA-like domain-containing protein n=1 Tax=Oligella urethralis TaxID=90245 RepID=UPI0024313538|nr:helicase HerA-like domain-containing protein [Oligella urethralis]